MIEENDLIEKIRRIERLFYGATTDGERAAAAGALDRVRQRLEETKEIDPPIEYKFTLGDSWSRKLLVALMRRYGLKPYRYRRQRYTTVMAKVPQSFVDQTLWPEFEKLSDTLTSYVDEITDRLISEGIYKDNSEADVIEETPKTLPGSST
jgi:hypothetical protein